MIKKKKRWNFNPELSECKTHDPQWFCWVFPPRWKRTWVLSWYGNAAMIPSCHRVSPVRLPSPGVGTGGEAFRAAMSGKPECWGALAWESHFPLGSLSCCWRVLQKRHHYLFLIRILFFYFLPFADENNGFSLLNYPWKKILSWYKLIAY